MATTTEIVPSGVTDTNAITMNVSASFIITLPAVIDSTVTFDAAIALQTEWGLILADTSVAIVDGVSFYLDAADTLASQLGFSETVMFFYSTTLVDSLAFAADAFLLTYPPAVTTVVAMDSTVTAQQVTVESMLSQLALESAIAATSTYTVTVQDSLSWIDQAILAILGAAWTAPTETFAMSRFEPFDFNSMAVVNGYLLAVGDAGLYQVGAGTEAVTATLTGGLSDFSNWKVKRPRDCWIEYQGKPPSISLDNGNGANRTYTVENPATTTRPTTSRAQLGRGLQSRHWRFTLKADGTILNSKIQLDLVAERR